nr:hypothetical protein [Tanacetum cinerariifolium]
MQTNQFAKAISLIPCIVDKYLDHQINEAVKVAVQLQSDRLEDEAQAKNEGFLNKIDENIQKIIKEQVKEQVKAQVSKIFPKIEKTVNEQLKAKVLTCSSNSSKTSRSVAANLSELELKKILIEKMESNKSMHIFDKQKNLHKALVDAYECDKLILDTYGDTVTLKRHRDNEDKDEEPFAGSNQGSKRRRAGKEPESTSAPKEKTSKTTGKSTEGSKSHHKSAITLKRRRDDEDKDEEPSAGSNWGSKRRRAGKEPDSTIAPKKKTSKTTGKSTEGSKSHHKSASESAPLEEPMHTTKDLKEPIHQKFNIGATDDQLVEEASHNLARKDDSRTSFNELMDTPLDFSAFVMNRLKVDTLTPELLASPTYELMKGSCKSLQYPHNLRKPLPLIPTSRGRHVIPFDHFINNDLEYLRGGVSSQKYTTLVTKTNAAYYGHIKWIEDMVPRTIWSQVMVSYDKHALWGMSHWGRKRQQFYGFAVNRESARDPLPLIPDNRGRRVIPFEHFINNDLEYLRGGALSRKYTTFVTKTKAADYGHIKWIEDLVPRAMWIQEQINYDMHAFWVVSHWGRKRQQFYGFAVNQESALDVYSKRRIIAVTELKIMEWHDYKHLDWISVRRDDDKIYKFKEGDFKRLRLQDIEDMLLLLAQGKLSNLTDGTLNDVRNALDDRLKGIRMQYLLTTIWRRGDKDRAATMIQAIEKMIKTRRIMRSLENFPLPLIPDNRGRRVIPFEHFIKNDLEYLRGGASTRKYTTSVTKTKAADYGHIKWIEDLKPRKMWIQQPIDYNKHALWRVSHWGLKRKQFYGYAVNRESARDVYSKQRIIAVTELQIMEWHDYKHLDWISVRRDDDQIYKFKEGNFKRLRLQDIEDMLLLLVQGKLSNLTVGERFAFNVSLRMVVVSYLSITSSTTTVSIYVVVSQAENIQLQLRRPRQQIMSTLNGLKIWYLIQCGVKCRFAMTNMHSRESRIGGANVNSSMDVRSIGNLLEMSTPNAESSLS